MTGKNLAAGALVLQSVGIQIGINLIPTLIVAVLPVLLKATGILNTIVEFLPVGLTLAMLATAFGSAVYLGYQGHKGMAGGPIYLILAVITLVIGVALILPILDAERNASVAAGVTNIATGATGLCTTANTNADSITCTAAAASGPAYLGAYQIPGASTSALTAAELSAGQALLAKLALTRTILSFVTLGFVLSLLSAAFALANVGTGGKLTQGIAGGYRRYSARRGM